MTEYVEFTSTVRKRTEITKLLTVDTDILVQSSKVEYLEVGLDTRLSSYRKYKM